jgi:hypothetical protein
MHQTWDAPFGLTVLAEGSGRFSTSLTFSNDKYQKSSACLVEMNRRFQAVALL